MENRQLRDTNNPEEMIPEPESESPGERDPHGRLPVHGALPPTRNLLLAALPDEDFRRLAPHLEPVALTRGAVLAELGGRRTHAFFPTEGIVSELVNMADGTSLEIAVVGNEGMVGVSMLLEGTGAPGPSRRSVVDVPGHAYRIRADFLMEEFERGGKLQHLLLLYTQALITQVAQIAACMRWHEQEAQLCRWLLQRLDRLAGTELQVTQREIADLLGVRREGVNEAASGLQAAGLIRCTRGAIEVLDREKLAKRGCECRDVIQKEYARLLGVQWRRDRRQHAHT